MFDQPENLVRVSPHAFEDSVAIEESVVVDADFGVLFAEVFPVDVDRWRHIPGVLWVPRHEGRNQTVRLAGNLQIRKGKGLVEI